MVLYNVSSQDFPGGPAVKNSLCNTGDMGLISGQGTKIPHAVGQLSSCASTMKPGALEPIRHNKREAPALQRKESECHN